MSYRVDLSICFYFMTCHFCKFCHILREFFCRYCSSLMMEIEGWGTNKIVCVCLNCFGVDSATKLIIVSPGVCCWEGRAREMLQNKNNKSSSKPLLWHSGR